MSCNISYLRKILYFNSRFLQLKHWKQEAGGGFWIIKYEAFTFKILKRIQAGIFPCNNHTII